MDTSKSEKRVRELRSKIKFKGRKALTHDEYEEASSLGIIKAGV